MKETLYKLTVFVPVESGDTVKKSMFDAGAARIGNYDCCSFETLGKGQFRPLENSNPYLGTKNKIEKVEELRIEMVCKESFLLNVIDEMKKAHPYEEVAYDIIKLFNEKDLR